MHGCTYIILPPWISIVCVCVCAYIYFSVSYFCSGSKIFSTFIGFLKSKDPSDGTEEALVTELASFNDYIKDNVSVRLGFP